MTRSGEASDPYTTGHRSDAGILTVELNGDMLTLGPLQTSYRVDGIERASSYRQSNNPADAVTTGTTMAAWDGARIVVEIRLKYPDNFRTVSARRVFSLTTDGGLLIETTGTLYPKERPQPESGRKHALPALHECHAERQGVASISAAERYAVSGNTPAVWNSAVREDRDPAAKRHAGRTTG